MVSSKDSKERQIIIAPSLLASDLSKLAKECNDIMEKGADNLHIDVMDGHFVPNLTFGPPVISQLRKNTKGFLDCHLMIENPKRWIIDYVKAGADGVTFHYEACKDNEVDECIDLLKEKCRVGIAIRPDTDVKVLEPFLGRIQMVLIMTVMPGFGGQSFMEDMMPKVQWVREKCPDMLIQVDGGISDKTISIASKAGANVFVAGSYVFKHSDPKHAIQKLRELANNE